MEWLCAGQSVRTAAHITEQARGRETKCAVPNLSRMCTQDFQMFDLEPPMAAVGAKRCHLWCEQGRDRSSWPHCNDATWVYLHAHVARQLQRNYILSRQAGIHGNNQLPDTERKNNSRARGTLLTQSELSFLTFIWWHHSCVLRVSKLHKRTYAGQKRTRMQYIFVA